MHAICSYVERGSIALLHIVCSFVALILHETHKGSLDPVCVVLSPTSAALLLPSICQSGSCSSWSLQQSHVRFMPLLDVSWLYKRR